MITLLFIIIAAVLVWLIITYNLFIRDHNLIKETWSGIDVQLKRRYNLIPNLVETVRGYSLHERKLFEDITEKRSKTLLINDRYEKAAVETDISGMLKNIIAVVENYPDLKANVNFLDLQKQLMDIEDQLQYARRYFNGSVRRYNIRIESFPSNIIASVFDFKQQEFFEITLATERQVPEVKL
ncbi:MAG TPA: LemA family protein [Ignavibacteriaceae bacterium]|nr:LemA family protein [Ignavibacteriaceae bacterium]